MKENTISVRLSEKTYSRLRNLAEEYGLNMSSMLAYLVNERYLSLGLASAHPDVVRNVRGENSGSDDYYADLADQLSDEFALVRGDREKAKPEGTHTHSDNVYSNKYKKKKA